MAKQAGPYFITGTIAGITFYKSGDQYLVRRAGGPSKKKIMTSPRFENTRRNISEFTACTKQAAFLRHKLANFFVLNDSLMYQRMTKLFSQLKNYDTFSEYGQRCFSKALKNKQAKQAVCNFTFNKTSLSEVLACTPVVNANHYISLRSNNIIFPEGANSVVITALHLQLDFENKRCSATPYDQITINKQRAPYILNLKPSSTCSFSNYEHGFYFLQIQFYFNNKPLNNKLHDVVACIAIDPELQKENKIVLVKGECLPYSVLSYGETKFKLRTKKIQTRPIKKAAPA